MTGISTRGLDQDETAELHRALVFFWWLALLLLPIGQEASSSAPPSPVLPLSLHAAFILGSTALLLLYDEQAAWSTVSINHGPPLTWLVTAALPLGLGTACLIDRLRPRP